MKIVLDHFKTIEELEKDLISWVKDEDIYSFERYLNKEDVLKIVELLIKKDNIIKEVREYVNHAQNYGTMAQVMPHLKPYVNGDDILEILDKENK